MNSRLRQIVRRRRLLIARAAEQRGRLAAETVVLRQSLGLADAFRRGVRQLRSQPLLVGAAAVCVMLIGPRRIFRIGYRSGLLLPAILRLIRAFRGSRSILSG